MVRNLRSLAPVKYALLQFQQLKANELVSGNALVEAGTFLAILIGTLVQALSPRLTTPKYIVAGCVVLFSLCGYLASRFIPQGTRCGNPHIHFTWRPIRQTRHTLSHCQKRSHHIAVYYGNQLVLVLYATYLTQFPNSLSSTSMAPGECGFFLTCPVLGRDCYRFIKL